MIGLCGSAICLFFCSLLYPTWGVIDAQIPWATQLRVHVM